MKNKYVLPAIVFLLIFPGLMQAQTPSAKAFFSNDSIPALYLGIDFTQARLINDEASNAATIQSQQFNGINDLMIKESKKYDIQEAYRRLNWTSDLKEVESRNGKADPALLKSSNDSDLYRLTNADIEKLVGNYNYDSHKGYGILLVMEGMDKAKKMATVWFTLINMDSKKILATGRVEGKLGSGFGFRNYWSSAIKNAIGQVKSKDYKEWQSSTNH